MTTTSRRVSAVLQEGGVMLREGLVKMELGLAMLLLTPYLARQSLALRTMLRRRSLARH